MGSEDLFELYNYNHEEETGRIFTALFNSSNLISPAYAAAIVLGISFGIAALGGLLYYGLIGGFDSGGSAGYGSYSSYFARLGFRRRRSTVEDDLNMVSILESLDYVEKTMNQFNKEIRTSSLISHVDLCKMKLQICHIAQLNESLPMSKNNATYNGNLKTLENFFMDIRKMRDDVNYKEHFGDDNKEYKRKLKVLEDVLSTRKYLQKKTNCEKIIQKCIDNST